MFLKILLLTWILKPISTELKSSLVVDRAHQKGIYLDDYCPKNPYCDEGTHVMCMYYDAHREYGPHCVDPRNVTITAELAIKFLDVTNAMRMKLATGSEVGHENEQLPRAYGMFKLQWDNELATFAQVLANQCLVRHDMCRGSKRFPYPGQTVGLIRFTSPDWFPAKTKQTVTKEPGLTDEKIMYAITTAMSSWYSHKKAVTPEMISNYPDWNAVDPGKDNGRLYMDMVYGPATHMGCGISAFTYYTYYNDKSKLIYNVILVVCNYSEGPFPNKSVYDLEREEHTSPCGCPSNAVEDENCLCSYADEESLHCKGVSCDQEVILLPIFTVEDAPLSKMVPGRQIKQRSKTTDSMEIVGAVFPRDKSTIKTITAKNEHPIVKVLNGIMNNEHLGKPVQQASRAANKRRDKPSGFTGTNLYHKQAPAASAGHVPPRKTSIFSRSILFATSKPNVPLKLTVKKVKKDVKKRKDFSKAKSLVNSYMKAVKNYTVLKYKIHIPGSQDKTSTDILNKAENDVIIYNSANDTFHIKHNEIENIEGDGDTKLMTLLDKLEEEVQHIELSGSKKELFDAKIRKIYHSVVGKPSSLPEPTANHHIELEHGVSGPIEKVIERTSREIETKRKEKDHLHDDKYYDIAKTIDEMVHNHHDETHRINLDEDNDGVKSRRTRVKSRGDDGYNTDREGADYELRRRENAKRNMRAEKLSSYDTEKEYKAYTFPEHRQSYKSKDQEGSYESFKMRFGADEVGRRDTRLKHLRDYYKSRNINSVENLRKKHYRRHHVTDDIEDDVMSPERRKYYQDRLDNLKRKLYSTRIHKFRNEDTDHRRRALRLPTTDDEAPRRPSRGHLEHFDMRERSRFIHAY